MTGEVRDTLSALEQVRDGTLDLLAGLRFPPTVLRLQAAGVTIELEWSEAAGPAAGTPPPPVPAAAAPAAPADDRAFLRSPSVGMVYHAPEPGAKPFVQVGDTVAAGQQVAIVEVMKLMIPVTAEVAGEIVEVLCGNATAVEFGEPLFAIAT
ncbi:acetyl-CoA carboxylase biotin carboxyl carrier protein [Actinomadura syzygii]|uniref:Biotin carboxyl carrier protein of acetyl-CoA carboxylase n=1 Tax=Actinomadura syzygii TaxID=1427538 RepID=A0A5D0UFQ2_9ACTN|nr:biotin/lipoyl-containing protein [Actinomadura syzygii]TYC15959.1 acetyl-CoA carboxylase biotin carboxyl carrier protein subunit [Actinomadura syzygii]